MKYLYVFSALLFLSGAAHAAPTHSSVQVDALDPINNSYMENFCRYHPASGICYFTPNPPVKPKPTNPGGGDNPPIVTIPGGPPPVLCAMPTSCKQNVSGATQLQSALNSATCGCEIVVSAGNYGGNITYNKSCSAAKPLMVRAVNPTGVNLTGTLNINGTYGIFQGFNVGGKINIAGDYNRVTRMLFTGSANVDFVMGAAYNRFDHNDVIVAPKATTDNAFMEFFRPRSVAQMYTSNRIDTNFWTTNSNKTSSIEGMGIFHGEYGADKGYADISAYGSFKTIFENNLWQNWGRKNVLESKSNDNIFRNNTLINTGRVLNRHGGRNLYQNNIFDDMTTGLAIREFDNQIIGNYFNQAKLIIYKGTRKYPSGGCFQARAWMPAGYQAPQGPPAVRTIIDKNRGPMIIGDQEGAGCEVPVLNTQIRCHEGGPIDKVPGAHVGTTGPTSTSGCFVMPHRLTRAEVGRGAPEVGCN